jgi:hypothetical protein
MLYNVTAALHCLLVSWGSGVLAITVNESLLDLKWAAPLGCVPKRRLACLVSCVCWLVEVGWEEAFGCCCWGTGAAAPQRRDVADAGGALMLRWVRCVRCEAGGTKESRLTPP